MSDEIGIGRFLAAQAGALRPLERCLEASSGRPIWSLLPDWPERRRAHLLDDIMVSLPEWPLLPLRTASQKLGAAYVLEGSRLGARVLLSRVLRCDSEAVRRVTRFLSHGTERRLWPSFLAALDRSASEIDPGECVSAAKAAFALFESAADSVNEEARDGGTRRANGCRSESVRHSFAPIGHR